MVLRLLGGRSSEQAARPHTVNSARRSALRGFDKNGTGANTFPNRSLVNRGNRSLPQINDARTAMTMSFWGRALRLH